MRIAFIGNCQVQSLEIAAGLMLDDVDIRVFDYSQPYSREDANRRDFADRLVECDLIFAQTALMSHTGEKALRPRYGDKLVTIANFFFRGLFPDSCYIGGFAERLDDPTPVNSVIVLDAFLRGLTEAEALRNFNIETFERLGVLAGWASSMHEMRLREDNRVVDVPAADFMDEACRRFQAFLTMNHPTFRLLTEYLIQVFRFAGLRHRHINPLHLPDPLAHHDTTPVLDEVAEYYQLPYRTTQRWKINALDQRFIGRDEYVDAFYATYSRYEPARLVVHSPTDLVDHLRTTPGLGYLVQADEALLPTVTRQIADVQRAVARVGRATPVDLLFTLASSRDDAEALRSSLHRIHSFAEIADPKVEWLGQQLELLRKEQVRLLAMTRPVGVRRMRKVQVAGALAVLVVLTAIVLLIG